MSQDELAKKLGYTNRSTISRIEKDETDPPLTKLIAYAEVLDLPPEDLIDCVDESKLLQQSEEFKKYRDKYVDNISFRDKMFARYNALFDLVKEATPEEMDQIEQIVKVIVKGNKNDG